jgi:hypothetical protein
MKTQFYLPVITAAWLPWAALGQEQAPATCGGIAGLPCPEGQVCVFPIGACFPDASGTCRPQPAECPEGGRPVCGCDGVSYRNACEAQQAGVVIAHRGACQGQCFEQQDCAPDDCCIYPAGECGGLGECQPKPDFCPLVIDPVCGCDGQTYSNACFAHMDCESVAHEGECVQGACTSNADCPDTEYCNFPGGTCGPTGQCEARPEVCIQVFDPVCGCDGQTYSNACVAASAGVSVAHEGECP